MAKINWRKGLLRLWLVCSLIWAGVCFLGERPDRDFRVYAQAGRAIENAEAALELAFWVLRGFARRGEE